MYEHRSRYNVVALQSCASGIARRAPPQSERDEPQQRNVKLRLFSGGVGRDRSSSPLVASERALLYVAGVVRAGGAFLSRRPGPEARVSFGRRERSAFRVRRPYQKTANRYHVIAHLVYVIASHRLK
ncbi:hypothetical protein EVAR_4641_1 [Eumeta japonica]|uniref:Uncharacterized protein n=1 Tax=Eumeta variegata TaxID=151549 RepID=A0A4C1SWH2_EUMVA|nr:hypothetical protein EVAR_4641_1 [Eumeta japonica]